ncbi:MAG TPA: DUF721 domain-containing protein, partial [Acidimicrobiales bacterium]|nr:DUF721 domain-containing protein [Acidimicrobiales bacterium]
MSSPRPLAAGLDHVLAGLGAPTVDALTTLLGSWSELVGPDLAAHAEPLSVSRGCLVVAVDDPAWAERLAWSEGQVVARAEALVGAGVVERVTPRVRPRT